MSAMNHHNGIVAIDEQRCITLICYHLGKGTVAFTHYDHSNDAVSLPSTLDIFCVYLKMKEDIVHPRFQAMVSIVLMLSYAVNLLNDPVFPISCNGCFCYLGCGM